MVGRSMTGMPHIRKMSAVPVGVLLSSSCAILSILGVEGAWAKATLRKLTVREKIAQYDLL